MMPAPIVPIAASVAMELIERIIDRINESNQTKGAINAFRDEADAAAYHARLRDAVNAGILDVFVVGVPDHEGPGRRA